MATQIVIDCPHCAVRVKSEAKTLVGNGQEQAYFLVECPSCHNPLFGSSFAYQDEFCNWCWDTAERLWPTPSLAEVGPAIPEAARRDIKDAQKCISHGIYSAAAVLCGRALERLIKEKAGANMIGKGLAELKAKGIIDERLYSWAEALRKERNIGAHASDEDTTKENAQDIIDFTIAIFDYVYTLSEKYEQYLARKSGIPSGGNS
jgi:HEPN domain-containing protein